ncbi:Microsomal glutathione S-transferase 2 [Holothuria leucospilota]|uniref:Microsomal glutathione S-transferase 2 n=1 Tax=Holothuria leucospilota TaxID=206669 RepID=A0A9Q1BDN3_HOLLE|nr:Microsomal glutathione S-transferase 2 [Holothuria leucospilota]
MAAQLDLKEIFLPSIISLAASYQLGKFARTVGKARGKFKVPPPATDGDEGFVRVFRAQQNTVEMAPIFYSTMWVSSIFFHPGEYGIGKKHLILVDLYVNIVFVRVPSAVASVGYLYARHQYFHQYSKDAESRIKPFILSIKFIQILFLMSFAGVINFGLKSYMNVDIPGRVMDFIGPYIKH